MGLQCGSPGSSAVELIPRLRRGQRSSNVLPPFPRPYGGTTRLTIHSWCISHQRLPMNDFLPLRYLQQNRVHIRGNSRSKDRYVVNADRDDRDKRKRDGVDRRGAPKEGSTQTCSGADKRTLHKDAARGQGAKERHRDTAAAAKQNVDNYAARSRRKSASTRMKRGNCCFAVPSSHLAR